MTTYPIAQAPNDYGAVFHKNILRSLQVLLTQMETEGATALSATLRARLFAAFEYAFDVPAGWPTLRLLLRRLTPRFNLAGAWTEWAPYLEKGLAADAAQEDDATRAVLLADLGLMNQRLSQLAVADAQLAEAATLARAQGDADLLALALQRRAEVARLERRYADCTALLTEAGALFPQDATAQAQGLFVAGKAAFDQHDLIAAATAFTEAMTLWQAAGNQGLTALCIQNLGRIAAVQGELQAAITLYTQAIDRLIAAGDRSNLPVVQLNLGAAYYHNQQFEQAISLYKEAETNFQLVDDHRYLAMLYNNWGLVHVALHEWSEAEAHLQRAILLHQRVGDNKAWINTKGNLGIAYLQQAHYQQAIQTFQEALIELQATPRDPEHERLQREINKYLTQAQEHEREQKKR